MARWRQAVEVTMTDEEIGSLTVLSRSRTEPASRVERTQMLLALRTRRSLWGSACIIRRSSAASSGRWCPGKEPTTRVEKQPTARDPASLPSADWAEHALPVSDRWERRRQLTLATCQRWPAQRFPSDE
jgi:hypothetical protein